jgi:RNA polymerase sigma-70 factor (ECF subfamily)
MDSDESLFERLIAGDMLAFDRIYDRFERPLFGFIQKELGDPAEAEDVFHETFLALLRERDRARSVRSFRAWLFGVARNICLNRVRSRRRAARALEAQRALPRASESDDAVDEQRRSAVVEGAVERLPRPLAELYRLRAVGMTYDEIADALSLPVGTVKSRMHQMIQRLRREALQ